MRFSVPEKRPLPSPTAFTAFRVCRPPQMRLAPPPPISESHDLPRVRPCPRRRTGPAAPPPPLHRGGVGGEGVAGHPWGEGRACALWWEAGHAGGTLGSPSLGDGCLCGRVFTGVERWVCAPVHAEPGDSGAGGVTHLVVLPPWRMRRRGSRSRRGHAAHLAYRGQRRGETSAGCARIRGGGGGHGPAPPRAPRGEKDQLQGEGRTPLRALRVGKGGG